MKIGVVGVDISIPWVLDYGFGWRWRWRWLGLVGDAGFFWVSVWGWVVGSGGGDWCGRGVRCGHVSVSEMEMSR